MTSETKYIYLNDKAYDVDKLTEPQRYYIRQINDLIHKAEPLRFELDQIEVARQGFITALHGSLQANDSSSEVI